MTIQDTRGRWNKPASSWESKYGERQREEETSQTEYGEKREQHKESRDYGLWKPVTFQNMWNKRIKYHTGILSIKQALCHSAGNAEG